MHERSIVRSLLRQVEDLLRAQQAARVLAVRLSVGEFAGVEPELLRWAYEDMVDGTSAQGADLVLDQVPLEARCNLCGREFAVERFRFECPACGSSSVTVVRGEGLVLESVTLEGCKS